MSTAQLLRRNRATLKLLFVGFFSLAMLIPLLMVGGIINERQAMKRSAEQTISQRWGGTQTVGGLVLLVQTPVAETTERSLHQREEWRAHVLSDLNLGVRLSTEERYLGIYDVPVYTADIQVKGRFDRARLGALQPSGDLVFWLPLGDVRGIRDLSVLRSGDLEVAARPLVAGEGRLKGLQFTVPAESRDRLADGYSLDIRLAGSQALTVLPLADSTRVQLLADWPHPEFIGQFLPAEREISADETRALWQLMGLNRPFGDEWSVTDMPLEHLANSGFGMRLETPVDGYQRSERAVKYGFLFIGLTFFALFLFEVMTGRPVHPVPYMLTGAALAVFYLVLLALSEYLAFSAAFSVAAALLIGIVMPYTASVLGGRRRGALMGGLLALTYGLLYLLVSVQHAALLLGSLSLLLAIATLMYLTRRVDWYSYGSDPERTGERHTAT